MTAAVRDHGLFRRVESPGGDCAMGSCYVYHTSVPGVDTGVLIEFEGTLFLSDLAIRELAEVAGMNVLENAIELEQDLALAQHALAEALRENEDLTAQLDAVSLAVAHTAKVEAVPTKPRRVKDAPQS